MSSAYSFIVLVSLAWTSSVSSGQALISQNDIHENDSNSHLQPEGQEPQESMPWTVSYGATAIQALYGLFKSGLGAVHKTPLTLKALTIFLALQSYETSIKIPGATALLVENINQTLPYQIDGPAVRLLPLRITSTFECNATIVLEDKNSGNITSPSSGIIHTFAFGVLTARQDPVKLNFLLTNLFFTPFKGYRTTIYLYPTITEVGPGGNQVGERAQGTIQLNPSLTNTTQSHSTSLEELFKSRVTTMSTRSIDQKTTTSLRGSIAASIPIVLPINKPPYEIIGGAAGGVFLLGIIAAAIVGVKRGWCTKSPSGQPDNPDNSSDVSPHLNHFQNQGNNDVEIKIAQSSGPSYDIIPHGPSPLPNEVPPYLSFSNNPKKVPASPYIGIDAVGE